MLARLFRNKVFWLAVITIAGLIGLAHTSKTRTSITFYEKAISYVYSPIQKGFTYIGKSIQDTLVYFADAKSLSEENKNLKVKIAEMEEEKRRLMGLEYENKRLMGILGLKGKFDNYSMVTCRIISKESGNWFSVFTIDKGSSDGISANMAVITPKGLVGQVISTAPGCAKVMSVIDSNSSVSGRLTKSRDLVILRGDFKLKDEGLMKMQYIPIGTEVTMEEAVETSGIGGIYPPGILIGKVKTINLDKPQAMRYAVVQSAVDFMRLEEVVVLKPMP